ncbi:hypothetical protein F8154_02925 [Alkaliphilus pronyensis]|uniref:Bypass of forespore C C-terminal domain-containing protein n=1 Tax=Alkaliphilus pronyensis TaxID=1482732 RepID=A0A6I0FGA3_9FIRM|nr:BofC C-terminal domain-containing protein [Alkaliphilus pronyensis]KAB3537263.1 hypothetical protein F8154_02925 [Alkaliphilus pronyensis]
MRRRRRTPYFLAFFVTLICFVIIGFLVGYYMNPLLNKEPPQKIAEKEDNSPDDYLHLDRDNYERELEENDAPVTSFEDSIDTDTRMVFRSLYTSCQSIIDEVIEPMDEIVGLKEGAFRTFTEENMSEWQVVKFSNDEVILFRRKNQICPNHFLVSQEDGFIAIFQYNEAGEKILAEKTSIPISVLPTIDQDKLKRGILLKSREEVNRLLEDYSS